jgi:hypothetical protein
MRLSQNNIFVLLICIILSLWALGCINPQASSIIPIPPSSTNTHVLPTEFLKDSLNDLIVTSDSIVYGIVTSQRFETVAQGKGTFTYTYTTLTVDKVIKGDFNTKEVIIKTAGGQGIMIPGELYLLMSDKVLICLHKENDNIYSPQPEPVPTSGPIIIGSPRRGALD